MNILGCDTEFTAEQYDPCEDYAVGDYDPLIKWHADADVVVITRKHKSGVVHKYPMLDKSIKRAVSRIRGCRARGEKPIGGMKGFLGACRIAFPLETWWVDLQDWAEGRECKPLGKTTIELTGYQEKPWGKGHKHCSTIAEIIALIMKSTNTGRSTIMNKRHEQLRYKSIIKCTDRKGYMIHPRLLERLKSDFTPKKQS